MQVLFSIRAELERIAGIPTVIVPSSSPVPSYPFAVVRLSSLVPVGLDNPRVGEGVYYTLYKLSLIYRILESENRQGLQGFIYPFKRLENVGTVLSTDVESIENLARNDIAFLFMSDIRDTSGIVGEGYELSAECDLVFYYAEVKVLSDRSKEVIEQVEIADNYV